MGTRVVPTSDPESIPLALEMLRAGGLVAFPTDTVYGLGALAYLEAGVAKLYAAKGRDPEKALPILISDAEELGRVGQGLTGSIWDLAEAFWPGPLTLVVPKRPALPDVVSVYDTVGVRVPDHPVARELLRAAGPMAVTSANRSGGRNSRTPEKVLSDLCGRFDLLLDGGETPGGQPSTVVDCSRPEFPILRPGPISAEEIRTVIDRGRHL
jgi:L-threonylcarbamoyladenylate synthase